jgi:hypothetical protein
LGAQWPSYSDKHTVFRINRSNAPGGTGMTQFGRALAELNIEIICANSSQAKGRVERVNRTLQDRLVKELRLANISDMDAGNAFLPSFLLAHNERFAVTPGPARAPLHLSIDVSRELISQANPALFREFPRHIVLHCSPAL